MLWLHARPSGGTGRHKGLEAIEPPRGNARSGSRQIRRTPWRMLRANAEPSPKPASGRCREQTAGTYSRRARVKACSRPRTPSRAAAKAEVARKSLAARRAGSIPASGTSHPRHGRGVARYGRTREPEAAARLRCPRRPRSLCRWRCRPKRYWPSIVRVRRGMMQAATWPEAASCCDRQHLQHPDALGLAVPGHAVQLEWS